MVSAFGPAGLNYPLRYAPPKSLRYLVIGTSVVLFAGGAVSIFVALESKNHGVGSTALLSGLGFLIVLFAIFVLRFTLRTALILYADRLEYRGSLRDVFRSRADIAGRSGRTTGAVLNGVQNTR